MLFFNFFLCGFVAFFFLIFHQLFKAGHFFLLLDLKLLKFLGFGGGFSFSLCDFFIQLRLHHILLVQRISFDLLCPPLLVLACLLFLFQLVCHMFQFGLEVGNLLTRLFRQSGILIFGFLELLGHLACFRSVTLTCLLELVFELGDLFVLTFTLLLEV